MDVQYGFPLKPGAVILVALPPGMPAQQENASSLASFTEGKYKTGWGQKWSHVISQYC